MSDCPRPEGRVECMQILGSLQTGQAQHTQWLQHISEEQKEQGKKLAYISGRLSEKRSATGKIAAALTVIGTAIAGTVAAIWGAKSGQ